MVLALPFPRFRKRGPIEASDDVYAAADLHLFPRFRKRGPIEAVAKDEDRLDRPSFVSFDFFNGDTDSSCPLARL